MSKQTEEQIATPKKEEIADEKLENVSGGRGIQMTTNVTTSATTAAAAIKRRLTP